MWGFFLNLFYCLCRLCSSDSLEMERNEPTHSEDPNSIASSSSTSPPVGDCEGGTEEMEGKDYEVFLSFRGTDTRKGFTDYLYTSLVDAGIHVFRDDNELRVGEKIGPELLCRITQSQISIPIISEDYASSKWCLLELARILKCKRSGGQIVLPIFYKVNPWQVRHLIGRWGDAINSHKENSDEMVVKEWEEALKEVSSLKGWESEKVENGHEGALVKIVVRKVMSELKRLFQLNVSEKLVGIDDRVEQIRSKIDAKFHNTWIIGIYGMGGVGKTTLAKVLYNELSSDFENRSFVADIRETAHREGIKCLQKQLISDIIGKSFDVSNVDQGSSVIKSRFTSKKSLILLDDMDNITQLNALVGDHSWFKAGSIVIITTRDRRILDEARADHMYPLDELPFDQSLILFSRHAFRKDNPQSDYEVISRDVVSTTGGLPLALEVIGSFLSGKKEKVWKETLKQLKKVPDKKVQETLRISYDALEYEEQQIFLDIACFFIGSFKESPTYMWDACDFLPEKGIEVLSLMSLIKVREDGYLMMHDQLRDLGRQIVRLENQREPQNRSRIWINEEAANVINNNKGTSKIEALSLPRYVSEESDRSYTAEKFKELANLRFLQVSYVNFTGDFRNLLSRLRWLEWTNVLSDFEAANFHLKELIVLDLSKSRISEDWGGWGPLKVATKLKVLNLTFCHLRITPDLSAFKSLEILILAECKDLEEIHPSIEDVKTLVSLNVRGCIKLKELPPRVGSLTKLETLDASDCASLAHIPSSIGHLASLSLLDLTGCDKLAQLPDSISLVSLERLLLSGCHSLRKIPDSIGKLTSLTELRLKSTALEELPPSIGSLKKLKTLDVSYCTSFTSIPSSIGHLESLSLLDLTECDKLAQLPDCIGSLASLECLSLSGCHSLRAIPYSIGNLTSLTELRLDSTAIVEMPESIKNMQNLGILDISETPLVKLLGASGIVADVQELRAAGRKDLEGLPSNTHKLISPDNRDLDKLQKLSELRSRVVDLVLLKRHRTPPANNSAMDYRTADSELVLKRSTPSGISDEKSESTADVKPRIADESGDKSRIWKLTEINEPLQCRSIRLHDNLTATRVSRLIYTNSGRDILALSSNAVHKLWKWHRSGRSLTCRLWQPSSGTSIINDISDTNPEDAVPCFALSKNYAYLVSASGGKISLFNMLNVETLHTFMPPPPPGDIITIGMEDSSIQIYSGQVDEKKLKGHRRIIKGFASQTPLTVLVSSGSDSQTMTICMPKPPVVTFLALYPQDNNIIAIGMEDSSIYICNIRIDEFKTMLRGHHTRITGLAFSNVLNVLVSSGADSQLCVWSTDGWEKQASKFLQMPTGRGAAPLADTRVQFHVDQIHLLVVHETQITT